MIFLDFFFNIFLFFLFFYCFLRLLFLLIKKQILTKDDIFYITSTPWEYKKQKEKEKINNKK